MMTLFGGGGLLNSSGRGSSATGAVLILAFLVVIIGVPFHQLLFTPPLFLEENALPAMGSLSPASFISALSQQAGPAAKLSFIVEKMAFGNLSQSFRFVNLLVWAVGIVALFVMIRRMTARPFFSLVSGVFIAIHTLNIPAISMVSGRGLLVGLFFIAAATIFAPTEPPRDMYQDIPVPRPIVPLNIIFLVLAALSSPLWAVAPLWYVAFGKSFSHGSVQVSRTQVIGAAAATVLLVGMYGALAPVSAMWTGSDFSVFRELTAGFGALVQALCCIVYPRYIIWSRYAATFDASGLFILTGVVLFVGIIAAWAYIEKRKTAAIEVALGLRLLALGAVATVLEPLMTGEMPSMASPVILLPGMAILVAYVLSVIWRRTRRYAVLRIGFIALILLLLVTASNRNEAVAWRWKSWPNLGSFYTEYSDNDAMYHLAWAEYFIRTGDPGKIHSALKRLEKTSPLPGLYPLLLKARAYSKLGQTDKAAEAYKMYLEQSPKPDPKATMDYARVLIETGNFDAAEALLQPLAAAGGDAAYLTGIIHERRGDYAKARDALLRAAATHKSNPDILVALGRVLLQLRDVEKAKAYLELAMTKRSDYEVVSLLTECYMQLDKCVRAENLVRKTLMAPNTAGAARKQLETLLQKVKHTCFDVKDSGEENQPPRLKDGLPKETDFMEETAPPDDSTEKAPPKGEE